MLVPAECVWQAVLMAVAIFWDATLCNLVGGCQWIGGSRFCRDLYIFTKLRSVISW
jgi:hypothetical protein